MERENAACKEENPKSLYKAKVEASVKIDTL